MRKCEDFFEFVSKRNYKTLIEVGVWEGDSLSILTKLLVKNNKNDFRVFGIDLWQSPPDMVKKYGEERMANAFNTCRKCLKEKKIDHLIELMVIDSVKGAEFFEDKSVDYVFIDADHSYESVLADITVWYPKVKEGGIISGHDYKWWDTVKKAVDDFFAKQYSSSISLSDSKDIWFHIK